MCQATVSPTPVRAPARRAAVPTDDSRLRGRAVVVVSGQAFAAGHTGLRVPAEPDRLPGPAGCERPLDRGYAPDNFVSGDKRVLAETPLVVEHAEVAVADAPVAHVDIDVLRDRADPDLYFERLCGPAGPGCGRMLLRAIRRFSLACTPAE